MKNKQEQRELIANALKGIGSKTQTNSIVFTPFTLGIILEPILDLDRSRLREVAKRLKQNDGESWAVGEMLERICRLLNIVEPEDDSKTGR